MRTTPSTTCTAVLTLLFAGTLAAQDHQHGSSGSPANEKLGTVDFRTSCAPATRPAFNRAVALLHSFEFSHAIEGFNEALEVDPGCAIAEWGIALSQWGNPFGVGLRPAALLQRGHDAAERGRKIGAKTPREAGYVDAVARLYTNVDTLDQRTRMVAYRDAMAALAAAHPDDSEASIFYALSITAAAPPTDKTYADQLKAGAILERYVAAQPDHPGLAHYIIHTYDVPPLAERALEAARRYAKIAPSAPHALHMPSHTFTRVGYWNESIETNIASAEAARRDGAVGEELHAMDYRTYAYLQSGRDAEARKMLEALPEVSARFDPGVARGAAPPAAGVFALATIPARYTLERGAWVDAAKLEARPSPFAYADAQTWFAKALGAARAGDGTAARSAIDSLTKLRAKLIEQKEGYWAEQADIQRRAAGAWLALAEGRKDEALTEMRAAAAIEDGTEKSAITPGPLAPARELVGEMLLQMNRPADALEAFEATLKKEPNRFRALYGAGKAASLNGNREKARSYFATLLKVCDRGDVPGRPELDEARRAMRQ
jgi:tetratricopeptide (TPR) repeat protein